MFALRLGHIQELSDIETVLVSLVDLKVHDPHRLVTAACFGSVNSVFVVEEAKPMKFQ